MISITKSLIVKTFRTILKSQILYTNTIRCTFSKQNHTFPKFSSFVNEKLVQSSQICQLKNYQTYLIKHNQSIKKPHERLQRQEQRIIKKYLQQQKYEQIITFLIRNINRILCYHQTTELIDKSIVQNWNNIEKQLKIPAIYAMLSFRENRAYNQWKNIVIDKIKKSGLENIQNQELIVFLYGELINNKSLQIFHSLLQQKYTFKQIFNMILNILKKNKESRYYNQQRQKIISYLSLKLEPSLNKKQIKTQKRKRSLLQNTVQPFFISLNLKTQRQLNINNFYTDFLVSKQQNNEQQFIIEVNGNYHYTLNGKLRGKQILRNLIINEYAPLRIIHHNDFLLSKGHRNKMAHIQQLLQLKDINWQSKNQGTNSQWYVKVDQEFLKEIQK